MERAPHVAAFNRTERRKFAAHVSLFNAYLDAYVDAFPSKYADASALLFDTHSTVAAILDAPADRGYKNSEGWCGAYSELVMEPDAFDEEECEWPLREYVWYDSYHLSWKAQEELGAAVGEVSLSFGQSAADCHPPRPAMLTLRLAPTSQALSVKAETERFRQRRHQKQARRFGSHKVRWDM